ncbi:MAG: carboxylating nicotinate-nucleotide diphosphorylase [Nitrospira sp.]|nr:carboxylating nicotinate-nucleotide diphosphorylase [Nitrospira sp.]TKB34581.1 MAG: carboxylating nicotinate-nucleotide diphosphorylase [Nitrospira sp.]
MVRPPVADISRAVRLALQEDLPHGDVTTAVLFPSAVPARARIVAQQSLVVAGLAAAIQVFRAIDPSLVLSIHRQDGEQAENGDCLLQIEGDGRSILTAERVALNFLQHLSGIATLTSQFCDAVHGYPVSILDTRKTTPGLRALQKWAVLLGGGTNHRPSLSDGILIKDNHLALLRRTATPIKTACRKANAKAPRGMTVIVEVESLVEVKQALTEPIDIILLDNMTPAMVRRAVKLIKGHALVEVSGGITLSNVRAMAEAGPDRISIGALTHSAPAATLSLELELRLRQRRARRS